MTASTLITDYVAYGTFASRPATPTLATGAAAYYFATDTVTLYVWTGASWQTVAGGAGAITCTFDAATSTVATLTAFAGAAAVVTSVADGDAYEINAVLKRNSGNHSWITLTKTKNATDGYFGIYQNDGNIISSTSAVSIRSSGAGVLPNHTGWCTLKFRITFTSAGYNFIDFPPAGNISDNNTLDFIGANIWVAAGVNAAGSIGKVTITKLN